MFADRGDALAALDAPLSETPEMTLGDARLLQAWPPSLTLVR